MAYIVKHDGTPTGIPLIRIVCNSAEEKGRAELLLKNKHWGVMRPGSPTTQSEDKTTYLGAATPSCDPKVTLFVTASSESYINGVISDLEEHDKFAVYDTLAEIPETFRQAALGQRRNT